MRRTITFLLACSLAVATLAGRASAASPPASFTFFGSGAGHGIGLSQWGSYGLSLRGWTPARILHHFYAGTRVVRIQSPPTGIRVALTTGRKTIHLMARGGAVRLWAGAAGQTRVGTIPTGETWRVIATPAGYAVRNGSGALVGGRRWGGPATDLFATYAAGGARVFVPEADASGAGFEYRRGTLEFNLYDCAGGCVERLILQIGFETYLYGLGEVPSSWPVAALRTQAIAARSYALYSMKHFGLRSSCNCHVLDDASDQVYVGWSKEVGADGARWVHAVQATAGTVVASRGSVIQAFYTASDGGHSENVEDVWHGGDPAFAIPYLRGVCDPGENTTANPYRSWSRRFTPRQLTSLLRSSTGAIGRITGFSAVRRGESGRIISLQARGTQGRHVISGSTLRSELGLLDTRLWVNSNRTIVGSIRAKYDSLMCAPGLPVSATAGVPGGARQWFASGGIYRNAKAAITVWLRGAVYAEYRAVGDAAGRLGLPTGAPGTPLTRARCAACRRVTFQRGAIWAKPGAGAHALWGPVYAAYRGRGGSGSALGFPTSRVRRVGGAATASFEHGTITCPPTGRCRVQIA